MSKQVQFRRGTTEDHRGFAGAEGEVTVDTSTRELVVHDGETPGGHAAARKPFADVEALLASREGPRGAGQSWQAGTFSYREGDPLATPDLVTAGGVELYAQNDSADAGVVGAPEEVDRRGDFAPALVASMGNRRLRGITLREILGPRYDPSQDASQTLNRFIPELAEAGIVINDPHNLDMLCTAPIRIQSGLKLHLGVGTTFRRGFSARGDVSALFSRADWAKDTDEFELINGVLTAQDLSQIGSLMTIYGNRWRIIGTRFLDWEGGQALLHGGDDNLLQGAFFRSSTPNAGTGPCRMIGGSGFRGIGLHAYGGDDLFQFVPITNQRNARFNRSISDSYYIGCHGKSAAARVLVAVIAGPQNEQKMSATLHDVGFIGCTGHGGNRSLVVENTEGDGTVPRQIDNVVVSGCALDGSQQGDQTRQDVSIHGNFPNAIGTVNISDTSIKNTRRPYGITVSSEGARLALDNVTAEGTVSSLQVRDRATIVMRGGRFAATGDAPGNVIDIAAAADDTRLLMEGLPVIEGVASNKAAIRISSGTARAWIGELEVTKRRDARDTVAVSHARGSEIKMGDVVGDLDADEAGSGRVTRT